MIVALLPIRDCCQFTTINSQSFEHCHWKMQQRIRNTHVHSSQKSLDPSPFSNKHTQFYSTLVVAAHPPHYWNKDGPVPAGNRFFAPDHTSKNATINHIPHIIILRSTNPTHCYPFEAPTRSMGAVYTHSASTRSIQDMYSASACSLNWGIPTS